MSARLKYGFCKKLLRYECNSDQLPIFSLKLDFSVSKILERLSLIVKNILSNVLITGKSNFDEKSGQLVRVAFLKR